MSVLFIDYGSSHNKRWDQLWPNPDCVNWTAQLRHEVENGPMQRAGQQILLLVMHAEPGDWEDLRLATEEAFAKHLAPPFSLRVSTRGYDGELSPDGWSWVSPIPLRNREDLAQFAPKFRALVGALGQLPPAPTMTQLKTAWMIWSAPPPTPAQNVATNAPTLSETQLGDILIGTCIAAQTWLDADQRGLISHIGIGGPDWWWESIGLSTTDTNKRYDEIDRILNDTQSKLLGPSGVFTPAVLACANLKDFFQKARQGALTRDVVLTTRSAIEGAYLRIANA